MWVLLLFEALAGLLAGLFIALIVLRFRMLLTAGALGGLLAGHIWEATRPTGLIDTAGVSPTLDLSLPGLMPHLLAGAAGGFALAGLIALGMGRRRRPSRES
ncbi:hypothetical protein [Pseudoroseicyclus tamaricis]|uniref:Uncharacterized protein n=1 Tax=Pseudoroseicyclus tamaricis TaxID=2705421 RepID=A0A6B2JWC2_9RHOB|nr:hypothetical protein [Pseudoroseicyclus tamaricis]NDV02588.1 hypothetical protein [Pseudoroseicyclus tamaricis]